MELGYNDVICRTLRPMERRVLIVEEHATPLVIEASVSRSAEFLQEFLRFYSQKIIADLARYGAILFRGFELCSSHSFEQQLLSMPDIHGISEIFLSEPGRVVVQGTRFVFHTNTYYQTGGTVHFGGFHTENHGVPDVPRYVAFFCIEPSTLGGETGLLDVSKTYADLPDRLKERLEKQTCLVALYPTQETSIRYGISEKLLTEFCKTFGIPIVSVQGVHYIAVYKPSVVKHPLTGERGLLVAFGMIPSIKQPLLKAFLKDYSGPEWALHRLFWRFPWLAPRTYSSYNKALDSSGVIFVTQSPPQDLRGASSFSDLFSEEDVNHLASTIRHRYSSFPWKRGDMLLLDNLKIAHNGMAGRGKRELAAMLCNPVPLPTTPTSSGLCVFNSVDNSLRKKSLGAEIMSISKDN